MNDLLNLYNLSLDYPEVSGAEQLELLMIRDKIAKLETKLTRLLIWKVGYNNQMFSKGDHRAL